MKNNYFFTLIPPTDVTKEDHYLSIINALVRRLKNYEDVDCVDNTLDNWHKKLKQETEENMYRTIKRKAELDGRTLQSVIDEYGYKVLGFSKKTQKRLEQNNEEEIK